MTRAPFWVLPMVMSLACARSPATVVVAGSDAPSESPAVVPGTPSPEPTEALPSPGWAWVDHDEPGLGRTAGEFASEADGSHPVGIVPANTPPPGSLGGGHPDLGLGELPSQLHRAGTTLTNVVVQPETQRSVVVGFQSRGRVEATGTPLAGLAGCLGRGGRTPGGFVDFEYRTGTTGAVEHVLVEDCGYPNSDVCDCMCDVVDTWQLPSSAKFVQVSMRVQTSAGELPPKQSTHAWDVESAS